MSDFFPFIGTPSDYRTTIQTDLPMFKELAYDFKNNDFIFDENNDLKVVEGKDAIKVWCYKAILTNRYEHLIYTWDYGTELINLVGQKFSKGLTESEAFRYVKEALMINPYIKNVTNKGVFFNGDVVTVNILIDSIYGEVSINV